MALGLLDLSIVTDYLLKLLNDAKTNTQLWNEEPTAPAGTPSGINPGQSFNIEISGNPPDTLRDGAGCQLSMYLFHLAADKFQRNAPVTGPYTNTRTRQNVTRVPTIPAQPLSLELYYILTAYAQGDNSYIQEQQAMSIALKCFHENPIVRPTVPVDGRQEEFCLTMEVEPADKFGMLWQAMTVSLRLAVLYKVSVVFIEPPAPPPLAPPVGETGVKLSVFPTALPFAEQGQVIGTFITISYTGADNTSQSFDLWPAVVAPGQNFLLYGAGLDVANQSDQVYLLPPGGGAEQNATTWVTPPPANTASLSTASRFALTLPSATTLTPGIYQLQIGNQIALGATGALRSNATPFSIAAFVDPTGGPILAPVGNIYTLNGLNFVPGNTQVLLGMVALTATDATPPSAGQFNVQPDGKAITFALPANLPSGTYAVRVRVNQVESPPAQWVTVT
jgi:hypothetical protein